jgi:hypothetical protein
LTFLLTGLDIEDKAALVQRQFLAGLERRPAEIDFRLQRTDHPDADTQAAATAMLTIVAWDPDKDVVGRAFSDAAVAMTLSSYPGATPSAPPGRGGPYGVYIPAYLPQGEVPHVAVLPDGTRVDIAPPEAMEAMGDGHASDGLDAAGEPMPAAAPRSGSSTRRPLGSVLGARSGDKGGTANIGLWAGDAEAYRWMRDTLTVDELRRLLPETADLPIERYELPRLHAVNFVIDGLLGKGVAHGYRWDPQAKGLAEWLRSRVVDIPDHITAPVPAAQASAKENA